MHISFLCALLWAQFLGNDLISCQSEKILERNIVWLMSGKEMWFNRLARLMEFSIMKWKENQQNHVKLFTMHDDKWLIQFSFRIAWEFVARNISRTC